MALDSISSCGMKYLIWWARRTRYSRFFKMITLRIIREFWTQTLWRKQSNRIRCRWGVNSIWIVRTRTQTFTRVDFCNQSKADKSRTTWPSTKCRRVAELAASSPTLSTSLFLADTLAIPSSFSISNPMLTTISKWTQLRSGDFWIRRAASMAAVKYVIGTNKPSSFTSKT